MEYFHYNIKNSWHNFSLITQMANIGAEVCRAIKWKKKANKKIFLNAFYRAIELLDLSINDPKNKIYLKELLRLKELLGDYLIGKNQYHQTDQQIEKYFHYYALAERKNFYD